MNSGQLSISSDDLFLFLCGANKPDGTPSARRESIKQFIESLSKNHHVIYAENVFNELSSIGNKKNILDIEHELSELADKIIIVLESHSAFCELGAFSSQEIRRKLLIINDSNFKNKKSFINIGPISAAKAAKSPVIYYPMSHYGVEHIDGIGATFASVKKSLEKTNRTIRNITIKNVTTELKPNKYTLYFIHDIIFIVGPVEYKELIEILKFIVGDRSFDVIKSILGILTASEMVKGFSHNGSRIYSSLMRNTIMKYQRVDIGSITASFRLYHMKNNKKRIDDARNN
ncbi:retron St85 family effector protein [Acidithiobacillus caldus]